MSIGKKLSELVEDLSVPDNSEIYVVVNGVSVRTKLSNLPFLAGVQEDADRAEAAADAAELDAAAAANAANVLNYQGAWDNVTSYTVGQSVSHDNLLWVAQAANTNSEPDEANADWMATNVLSLTDFPYLAQNKSQAYWLQQGLVRDGLIPEAAPSMLADFVNRKYELDGEATEFATLFDFTRADTSLAFNTKGNLYAAAANEPAYDHDPTTGKALGVRLDKQKANLIEDGEDFTVGSWVKTGITVNAAATTFFDGLLNASELIESAAGGVHEVSNQDATVDQTNELGGIIYIKRGVGNRNASVRFLGVNPLTDANYRANIDLDDGSIINEVIGNDVLVPYVSVRKCVDDIFEVRWAVDRLNDTDDGDVLVLVSMLNGSDTAYVGDGVSSLYVSGAGFYQNASPNSYVSAAVGTQAQDRLRVVNPNFAKLFKDNCGTFVVRGRYATTPLISQNDRDLLNITDGTSNNVIKLTNQGGGDIGAVKADSAQTGQGVNALPGQPGDDQPFTVVLSYSGAGGVKSWVNGVAYADNSTDLAMDGVLDELAIGCNQFSTANADAWIKDVTVYPLGIPDADAQALSAVL